jgi:hypothetical protein
LRIHKNPQAEQIIAVVVKNLIQRRGHAIVRVSAGRPGAAGGLGGDRL